MIIFLMGFLYNQQLEGNLIFHNIFCVKKYFAWQKYLNKHNIYFILGNKRSDGKKHSYDKIMWFNLGVNYVGVEDMLELANKVRMNKALENRWVLYDLIDKNPGISIYELSKKLEWTVGKVNHHVNKLIKEGAVANSTVVENNRAKRKLKAKDWKELIDPQILKALKKSHQQNK